MKTENIVDFLTEAQREDKLNLSQASAILSCIMYVARMNDGEAEGFISKYGYLAYTQIKELDLEN